MLSIDRARQFYMENRDKFPGMNMTQAVEQMMQAQSLPAAPAPQAATEQAATMPVPTAAQVPAPAVPETPPPPPYKNQYELAYEAFKNAQNAAPAAPAAKGAPVDYAALAEADFRKAQGDELAGAALAARGATIDPKVKEFLDKKLTRTDQQLADLEKDRQQAVWMAIAQAGMKMAQSQSPYFLQALATGMEAGLTGYSEEKAKAAEKKARLQDTKEELGLREQLLINEARDKAVSEYRGSKRAAAEAIEGRSASLSNLLKEETAPFVIASARLEPEEKRARIAHTRAQTAAVNESIRKGRSAGSSGGTAALSRASEWAATQAAKALEAKGIGQDDPGYGSAFALETNRYRNLYFASNPVEAAKMGVNPQDIKLDWGQTQPKKEKKQGWLSGLFD